MARSVFEIPRNDVGAAIEVYRAAVEQGLPDIESIASMLLMLQDDPRELMRRFAAERLGVPSRSR